MRDLPSRGTLRRSLALRWLAVVLLVTLLSLSYLPVRPPSGVMPNGPALVPMVSPSVKVVPSSGSDYVRLAAVTSGFHPPVSGYNFKLGLENPSVPTFQIITNQALNESSCFTNASAFNCTLTVNGLMVASYSLTVSDPLPESASGTYTVTSSRHDLSLSASVSSGVPGTLVTVSGVGFQGVGTTLQIYLGNSGGYNNIGTATVASGTTSGTVRIPSLSSGAYTLFAEDTSYDYASTSFTVEASSEGSEVTLAPTSGHVGTSVTATGSGFAGNEPISLSFDSDRLSSTCNSNAAGTFSCSWTVPAAPEGDAGGSNFAASDTYSNSATATFAVTPALSLNPSTGDEGTAVTATGSGFAAGSAVSFTLDGLSVPSSCETGGTGSFSCTFTVPAAPAGDDGGSNVVAKDASSNTASASFTVLASLTVTPTAGVVGTTVSVSGTDFAASSEVTFTLDGGAVTAPSCSSGPTGSFSCTFTVPAAPAGDDGGSNVVATDGGSNSAAASFTVVPSLALAPTSGTVGTVVTATGAGFAAGSSVTFTVDGASAASTCTTNAEGSFSCAVTIPAAPVGAQAVLASDASSNAASGTFTIRPGLVLEPVSGSVGSAVVATGTGFAASSPVTFTFDGGAVGSACGTGASGSFSCSFAVPSVPAGDGGGGNVVGEDGSSDSASASFTVVPSLALSPTAGPAGTVVTATGAGFAAEVSVTFTFDGMTVGSSCSTSAAGGFTCTFTAPAAPGGEDGGSNVVATDAKGNFATGTFAMRPTLSLLPVSGPVGTEVEATGSDFAASSEVTFTLDGGAVTAPSCSSGPTGSFSCTFTVPAAPAGDDGGSNVVATDGGSNSAAASFTVVPSLALAPTSGTVGTVVTATGAGFAAGSSVTFTVDGASAASTCTTNAEGSFSCAVTIPAAPAGDGGGQNVVAVDSASNSASATFTVLPHLYFSPVATGGYDTQTNLFGTGYLPSAVVTLTVVCVTAITPTCSGVTFPLNLPPPGNACPEGIVVSPDSVTTTPKGVFGCGIQVPAIVKGLYNFTASDGTDTATTSFLVTQPPLGLSVAPTSGGDGTSLTLTGTGMLPLTDVTVSIACASSLTPSCEGTTFPFSFLSEGSGCPEGEVVSADAVATTPIGDFSCSFPAPPIVKGIYDMTATDGTNILVAEFTLTQPSLGLTVSPTTGPEGTGLTLAGTGFLPLTAVTLSVACDPSLTPSCEGASFPIQLPPVGSPCPTGTVASPSSVTTLGNGDFSCGFAAPPVVKGVYVLTASDGTNTLTADFTLTQPALSLSVDPTSGTDGAYLNLLGTGFLPLVPVTLTASCAVTLTSSCQGVPFPIGLPPVGQACPEGTVASVTSVETTADGSFGCGFVVPTVPKGTYDLTATDGTNTLTATFAVEPILGLSPYSGTVGSPLTVQGTGFDSGATIKLKFDGHAEHVVCVSGVLGNFTCSFSVPSDPAGDDGGSNVLAQSSGADSASSTFTIVPSITLAPTSGTVGSTVVVHGAGFAARSAITFSFEGAAQATSCKSSAKGAFRCTFKVPTDPVGDAGGSNVGVADAASDVVSATFSVTPKIVLSAVRGPVGASITATGSGFAGSSAISFSLDGVAAASPCTSAPWGSFACIFYVPNVASGDDGGSNFVATDALSDAATATFTVTSSHGGDPRATVGGSGSSSPGRQGVVVRAALVPPAAVPVPSGAVVGPREVSLGSSNSGWALTGPVSLPLLLWGAAALRERNDAGPRPSARRGRK